MFFFVPLPECENELGSERVRHDSFVSNRGMPAAWINVENRALGSVTSNARESAKAAWPWAKFAFKPPSRPRILPLVKPYEWPVHWHVDKFNGQFGEIKKNLHYLPFCIRQKEQPINHFCIVMLGQYPLACANRHLHSNNCVKLCIAPLETNLAAVEIRLLTHYLGNTRWIWNWILNI